MRVSDLDKLIAAVEAGTADADFLWPDLSSPARLVFSDRWFTALEAYLGSLDAALRLHEALLPGWIVSHMSQLWEVDLGGEYTGGTKDWLVNLTRMSDGADQDSAISATPARAWLLAVLRALKEWEEP